MYPQDHILALCPHNYISKATEIRERYFLHGTSIHFSGLTFLESVVVQQTLDYPRVV
jgi:hypothetical protein